MKPVFLLSVIFFFAANCFAQNNLSGDTIAAKQHAYVLGFLPTKTHHIYGLAIGPVGSEAICNRPYTKYSHGINIQIPGQGLLQTPYLFYSPFRDEIQSVDISGSLVEADTALKRVIHNGLLLSVTGTFSDQINGLSFSPWMSMGKKVNGLTLNAVWNLYQRIDGVSVGLLNTTLETRGLQVGLINKTVKLKGFQIGLWNKNEKRSLPFLNWNFDKE